jgi:hypothetical protein
LIDGPPNAVQDDKLIIVAADHLAQYGQDCMGSDFTDASMNLAQP